jgi:ribokinase
MTLDQGGGMASEPARVCVVGSSNIDLIFRTPRLPRPGETLAGHAFRLDFGGKGANQAVLAARLGARVAVVSRVGRDVFGEQTLANYRREGIDTAHVFVDEARPTGVASIAVDDDARNCILVVPGANLGLSPEDVRRAAPALRAAAMLLCQLEVPQESVLEGFRLARAAGVRTVLNPAPAAPLADELLRLADVCVPNEPELEALTGQPAETLEQAEAAGRALLRRGPGAVVVTLGGRGALVLEGTAAEHVPAVPVRAVDPTGAGDAFIGALGVSLAGGQSLRAAVRRANAVAALTVTRLGAQASFPSRAEIEHFLASAGLAPDTHGG